MTHINCRLQNILLAVVLSLAGGCSQNAPAGQENLHDVPLTETVSLGLTKAPAPELISTIILGNSKVAAEALLDASYNEGSALACVGLLLPRLEECRERMDDLILSREDGQPLWMRLYGGQRYSTRDMSRKHQILLRMADCIREASPSAERAQARENLFTALEPNFLTDRYSAAIAIRTVVFTQAFEGNIRSETGWDDLFGLLEKFILSDKLDTQQRGDIKGAYLAYCREYPDKEAEIIEKFGKVFGKDFAEFLEATRQASFVQPFCDESYYRSLLKKSPPEWVDEYAERKNYVAANVIEALFTGTRQARLESFPLVKPFLQTYRDSSNAYYHWVPLLRRYCLPVAENAVSEEIERQQWLLDELIGQVDRNERGDPKSGTDPIRLLRYMILPVTDAKEQEDPNHVHNPYGKERVLNVLLDQTVSTDTHAASSALRELEVLCKFDESTARSIEQGLTARKESILTKEYPSDDLSATSKEDIYKEMEHIIKRAQAELK